MFERIRVKLPKVATYLVYDGNTPAGMECVRRVGRRRRHGGARSPGDDGGGGDDDLHVGHHRQAQGCTAPRRCRSSTARRDAAAHRVHARRHLHHDRTLYHSGPGGFMGVALALGQTIVLQRKFDAEDWLRLVDTHRCTSTFAAPTPIRMICTLPGEVKGALRRVVDPDHDRQRRALELRAQAAVRRPPPAGVAVGGVRLDRTRGQHDPAAGGPDAQAGFLRHGGTDGRDPLVRRRRQRRDGDWSGPRRVELYVRSATTFADYYKRTTSSRRTTATVSRRWAISPTATTKASTTSATARRT